MQTAIATAYVTGLGLFLVQGQNPGVRGGAVHDKCYLGCGTWLFVLITVCDQL